MCVCYSTSLLKIIRDSIKILGASSQKKAMLATAYLLVGPPTLEKRDILAIHVGGLA
jgi:hypothetical protein